MNDWHDLTNSLDTEVQPLDELASARVKRLTAAALPRRRKKRWLAAALAAVLVLSACGVAVATGQFSDWFWNYSQDPKAPEDSEDLLAGLGTVIDQSQTVDGTTITLDGALWDGYNLVLALTVDGEDAEVPYGGTVKAEDSWLMPPRAELLETMHKPFPDMTEEELQTTLDEYLDAYRRFGGLIDINYIYNRRTESYQMQVGKPLTAKPDTTEAELVLHLENLGLKGGKTLPGPYEFTFTVEKKSMERVWTGDVTIQTPGGYDCRITKVTVSPFLAEAEFEMLEPVPEEVELFDELRMGSLRSADGQEAGSFSQHGALLERGENGYICGTVHCGPFQRVVDPAAVEAVQIGGTWVELSEMKLKG